MRVIETGKVVAIGSDGRCTCSCGTPCPLKRTGMAYRCTRKELEAAGIQTITIPNHGRRRWPSGLAKAANLKSPPPKLKPCPFCGEDVELSYTSGRELAVIKCPLCRISFSEDLFKWKWIPGKGNCRVRNDAEKKVIDKWNQRS